MTVEEERREAHFKKMTETPVPKLVAGLAAPTILSMLITSIYNMADTFFVSQLGTSAAGAVGVVFSLMAMIQAVGFTLGMGSGNLVSRRLGARDVDMAEEVASSGFYLALFLGLAITVLGTVFRAPLMRALGATETILPYAEAYGHYILFAAPIMCTSFVMNNLLRSEGKAALAMIGITTGGILNIFLDPLFIFTLGLGTAGAALATAVSQCVSFLILLSMFLRGKSDVHLRPRFISRRLRVYGEIIQVGFPSFCRQGIASLATMQLNVAAAVYGDAAVAAMSISNRIVMFMNSAIIGLGQGFQPVCGFNYGAGRFRRVREAMYFTAKTATALILTVSAVCFVFAPQLMMLFRKDDPEVIALGTVAFRAQCAVLVLFGIVTVTNMALQCTGHSGQATLLALCRQGLCFLPLILILPRVAGVWGVQFAQPIADVCTFCISLPFWFRFLKVLKEKERLAAADGPGLPAA